MDPNLFHLDEGRLFEVLFAIVVLAFFVERALSLVFGWKPFVERLSNKGVKEIIALITSAIVCVTWEFDAFSILFVREKMTLFGEILTGAIIAGGSKASLALFQDILKIKSSAEKSADEKKDATKRMAAQAQALAETQALIQTQALAHAQAQAKAHAQPQ
jgi:hypothetical protein